LAVTIYWGSGTGASQMDLHILKITQPKEDYEEPTYVDYALLSYDLNKWFTKSITAEQSKDKKTAIVHFNGHNYTIKYDDKDRSGSGNFNGIAYGSVVNFDFDQSKIKLSIGIGFTREKWAAPEFFGTVEATVNFKNNKYTLSDYMFIIDDEYK
jgi:hypothetical protein